VQDSGEYKNEIAIFYAGAIMEFKRKSSKPKKREELAFSYMTVSIEELQKIKEFDNNES